MREFFPFFKGRPEGADSIGHTACVLILGLAGGAPEADRPAARLQRASDGLHPGPGVAGAGPWGGRPALQLRLGLQEGDHPRPHGVSTEAPQYTVLTTRFSITGNNKSHKQWLTIMHDSR